MNMNNDDYRVGSNNEEMEIKTLQDISATVDKVLREQQPEKQYKKMMTSIEKAVRHSSEYKMWVKVSKEIYVTIEGAICACCGAPYEDVGFRGEVHHTPATLYEVCEAVLVDMRNSDRVITTARVVERVVDLHLNENVPHLVVCECCHKRLHYEKNVYGEEITLLEKQNSHHNNDDESSGN